MNISRYAGVDIGSNSIRLLIIDNTISDANNPFNYTISYSECIITRLLSLLTQEKEKRKPQNFTKKRTTENNFRVKSKEKRTKGLEQFFKGLEHFNKVMDEYSVKTRYIIGTEALRKYSEHDLKFRINNIIAQSQLKIISSEQEEYLNFLANLDLIRGKQGLLIDLGGGSSEFLFFNQTGQVSSHRSIDIGVVSIMQEYELNFKKRNEPLENRIKNFVLKRIQKEFSVEGVDCCIGTGGTITTLSAINLGLMRYSREKVNKSKLSLDDIENVINRIYECANQNIEIQVLQTGRKRTVVYGALFLEVIAEYFGFKKFIISDNNILHGLFRYLVLTGSDAQDNFDIKVDWQISERLNSS